ncbi:hypothetical protein EDD11_008190 [Mortierella claussenii]|nr:hypothetical protein EDD11_008190 [Mortierella claussenii]
MDKLSVIISSPAHTPHKFTLQLSPQCSILELKEIIVSRIDSRPAITDQRLIFGGRILDDKDTLERVFEKVDCQDNSPTIHLVVSQRQHTSAAASPSPLRFRTNAIAAGATPSPSPSTTPPAGSSARLATPTGASLHTGHYSSTFFTPATTAPQDRAEGHTTNPLVASATNSGTMPTTSFATGMASSAAAFSPLYFAQHSAHQPMQHVVVNGMPYLVPAAYMPILHHQHCVQQMQAHYGQYMGGAEGTSLFQAAPMGGAAADGTAGADARAGAGAGAGAGQGVLDGNARENAVRDQRRAASLWLLMKLAFGVYLFSQNGSIERIVLLHIAALIIFLHQTGRLRIVRRIGHPPGEAHQAPAPAPQPRQAAPAPTASLAQQTTTTATSSSQAVNDHTQQPSGSNLQSTSSSSTSSSSAQVPSSSTANAASTPDQSAEAAQQQQAPISTWRSIEHALLTFVTSLVPAPPPEIDQAVANAAAAGERGM